MTEIYVMAQDPIELSTPELLAAREEVRTIGLIALSTDLVIDPIFAKIFHGLPVELFINRVRFDNPVTPANLEALSHDLDRAVTDLLSDRPLDAIAFGCSSGAVAIGEERLAEKIQRIKPGAAVTNPVTAAIAAMHRLGARRISILTPYTREVNTSIAEFFRAKGLDVLSISGFGIPDDRDIALISPDAIRKGARAALANGSEAIFLSCTALRAAEEAEALEAELGLPVVTSNQALAWHVLRLAGCDLLVSGFGEILTLPLLWTGEANH